jgi:signal transduction histidine kinase
LARLLWTLLEHGARRADQLTTRAERVRRAEAVAAAARADERAHIAALHDTAASTLLMVGLGRVTAAEPWLRAQAGRDLAALGGRPGTDTAVQDVIPRLREVIAHSRVAVSARLPDSLTAPAPVCGALCGAVREALTNIERHAGTAEATVCVEPSDGRMAIVVSDSGTGFAPESVRSNRYGVAESIVGRMTRVGGHAELTSSLGHGTVVRMEWPVLEGPDDR